MIILFDGRDPPPALEAWIAQHRGRLGRPGLHEVVVEHDAHCPYPRGGPCSCANGPEIRLSGETPEEN
jgi:hypothetical protein